MKTIETAELHERLEKGPVALFDVRGDVMFEKGHIEGAKTAPLGSLVFRVARVMNPDSEVILYSNGMGCRLATEAADRLKNLGMTNIYVYPDGLEGWLAARLPVVESVHAKKVAWGPVIECRPIIVDRETAYGGAFNRQPGEGVAGG